MKFNVIFYIIAMILTTVTVTETDAAQQLPACPNRPNCVSTQATVKGHFIAPFKISGQVETAWAALKQALMSQERTLITRDTGHSLHAEATSRVFGFVDDIDAILDAKAKLIHIRSASRSGYGDFGVNRKRMERLRAQLQQAHVVE